MTVHDFLVVFLWGVPAYVLAGLLVTMFGGKGKPDPWRSNEFSQVKPRLEALLRSGYDAASVTFTHELSGRALNFRKYICNKDDYGIELHFPNKSWSAEYWRQLEAQCDESRLPYRVATEDSDGLPLEVLVIDFGQDADQAYELALATWTRIFGFQTNDWYERQSLDISPFGELIDSPTHPRHSAEEVGKYQNDVIDKNLRDYVGLTRGEVFYVCAIMTLGVISVVGLPMATLMTIGQPAAWSVKAGDLAIGGSTMSLVFFLTHIFSWFEFKRLRRKLKTPKKNRSISERTFRAGLPVAVFGLPIAVTLVWMGA